MYRSKTSETLHPKHKLGISNCYQVSHLCDWRQNKASVNSFGFVYFLKIAFYLCLSVSLTLLLLVGRQIKV